MRRLCTLINNSHFLVDSPNRLGYSLYMDMTNTAAALKTAHTNLLKAQTAGVQQRTMDAVWNTFNDARMAHLRAEWIAAGRPRRTTEAV